MATPTRVLLRYRSGRVGLTRRFVHVVDAEELAGRQQATALCGELLPGGDCEQVDAGVGMPCVGCFMLATNETPTAAPAIPGGR